MAAQYMYMSYGHPSLRNPFLSENESPFIREHPTSADLMLFYTLAHSPEWPTCNVVFLLQWKWLTGHDFPQQCELLAGEAGSYTCNDQLIISAAPIWKGLSVMTNKNIECFISQPLPVSVTDHSIIALSELHIQNICIYV